MKFKTVREGQQAVILNHMGEGELITGPKRVFLFRKRFQMLTEYTASTNQYLIVQEKDGTVYHKPGPCSLFHNPLVYEKIREENAIKLDANHVVVVYKRRADSSVERRVIEGPAVFVPEAVEWLHEFVWHGTDPDNKTRMVPGLKKFTQLTVIPDHFYYNVREVRTNDDTMITVKVMVFYVITDILKMLDTTHDPIADIINALCADVITFTSKLSYAQFVEQTNKLSCVDTYPQLTQRTQRIGLRVDKVVYRGYHASDQMQAMQNRAIESRTRLRLDGEMEDMQQKLTALKLNSEDARADLKKKMEQRRQQHEQRLEKMRQEHELQQSQLRHTQNMELRSHKTALMLDQAKDEDRRRLEFLTQLSGLEVNVTDFLVTQEDPPPARQIRLTDAPLPQTRRSEHGMQRPDCLMSISGNMTPPLESHF